MCVYEHMKNNLLSLETHCHTTVTTVCCWILRYIWPAGVLYPSSNDSICCTGPKDKNSDQRWILV